MQVELTVMEAVLVDTVMGLADLDAMRITPEAKQMVGEVRAKIIGATRGPRSVWDTFSDAIKEREVDQFGGPRPRPQPSEPERPPGGYDPLPRMLVGDGPGSVR